MTETYKNSYDYLGIAMSGCYAREPNCSISIPDKRLPSYYGDVKEGGMVMDKRTVEDVVLIQGVMSGPMLDVGLPSKTKKGWDGNEACENPEDCKSFDLISLDLYAEYWRTRGAKIGIRKGDTIVWENGDVDPIIEASLRWTIR